MGKNKDRKRNSKPSEPATEVEIKDETEEQQVKPTQEQQEKV